MTFEPKRKIAYNLAGEPWGESWLLTTEEAQIALNALGAMSYDDEDAAALWAALTDALLSR